MLASSFYPLQSCSVLVQRSCSEVGWLVFSWLFYRMSTAYNLSYHLHQLHIHRSPVEQQSVVIPFCYTYYQDVFCPKRASPHFSCRRPHSRWASALWLNLSPLHTWTEGHGEVRGWSPATRLHLPFNFPCCLQFFLCGQERRRLAALQPCIDYRAFKKSLSSSVTHIPSSQPLWNS